MCTQYQRVRTHTFQNFPRVLAVVLRGCVDVVTAAALELANIDTDDCLDEDDIPESFRVVRIAPVTSFTQKFPPRYCLYIIKPFSSTETCLI